MCSWRSFAAAAPAATIKRLSQHAGPRGNPQRAAGSAVAAWMDDASRGMRGLPGAVTLYSTLCTLMLLRYVHAAPAHGAKYINHHAVPLPAQVPLMRDPQTMLGHCVGCRRRFDGDGRAVSGNSDSRALGQVADGPARPAGPRQAGSAGTTAATATAAASNGSSLSMNPQRAARVIAPGRHTGSAPLAALPNHQADAADSGSDGEEDAALRARYQAMRAARAREEARRERGSSGAGGAAAAAASDPCQVLADCLVQGWAMLAEHCPL